MKVKSFLGYTAKDTIGFRNAKRKEWMTEETWMRIEERRALKIKLNSSKTRAQKAKTQAAYHEKVREVKREVRADRKKWVSNLAQEAEVAAKTENLRDLWNSTFDSLLQLITLLKNDSEKINQCLDYCNLQRLTENEIKFIDEYCKIMKPLAQALDILQSESGMYMGYMLPILKTLQEKLESLNKSGFTHCQSLITAIQQSLNKRFSSLFEKKELIIASCLHPKFKLNWINGEERKRAKNYLKDLLGIRSNESSSNLTEKLDDYDDFFAFSQQTKEVESAQEELYRFLKSNNCNIGMLNDYTAIKKLFIKYNTALPSSASVERMFSVGGSVITPQRGHLNDDIIEYQILLKINKNFY
ncbi:uncharacterized protein [Temnothorax nylanderi]|uniref:uncharacterized protein n=1 Tax=Temnothorax nylanderi TaxID=102681 RepID=UPI003A8757C5